MRDILERLESKVDKIDTKVGQIGTQVAKLEVHTERTNEELKSHIDKDDTREERLETLEGKDKWNTGALSVISIIITLVIIPLSVYWVKANIQEDSRGYAKSGRLKTASKKDQNIKD